MSDEEKDLVKMLDELVHDHVVLMQAAYIEWRHGEGADAAMTWIENTLFGPGHIPKETDPYSKDAQAYFDANRSNPFPQCHCGRPSHILHMGRGFCSEKCEQMSKH